MTKSKFERSKIWRKRVEAAESSPGGIGAYCKQEGIDPSSLYSWRRKFASERVPAMVTSEVLSMDSEPRSCLPDAKWVGEMLSSEHSFRGFWKATILGR